MNFIELFNRPGLIAAHRGANSIAPENTLKALKKSVSKCDFIEIDVQLSSDGVAVIFHDETLERTTDLDKALKVSELSFDELSKLDYGSWFDGEYEPILTLYDALKFIKENNLFLNVEIKDIGESFDDKEVVSVVLKEIQELNVQNLVLLSSFRAEYLPLCKETLPNTPTALLVEYKHPHNILEYLKLLKVDGYNISSELVDKEIIKIVKNEGYFVSVYTVNDKEQAQKLFKIGVNAVFSDRLEIF